MQPDAVIKQELEEDGLSPLPESPKEESTYGDDDDRETKSNPDMAENSDEKRDDKEDQRMPSFKACIIKAIQNSVNKKATLQEIYQYLEEHWPHRYRKDNLIGWRNSVRHNLSLHACFEKNARMKDTTHSCYWTYNPNENGKLPKRKKPNHYAMSQPMDIYTDVYGIGPCPPSEFIVGCAEGDPQMRAAHQMATRSPAFSYQHSHDFDQQLMLPTICSFDDQLVPVAPELLQANAAWLFGTEINPLTPTIAFPPGMLFTADPIALPNASTNTQAVPPSANNQIPRNINIPLPPGGIFNPLDAISGVMLATEPAQAKMGQTHIPDLTPEIIGTGPSKVDEPISPQSALKNSLPICVQPIVSYQQSNPQATPQESSILSSNSVATLKSGSNPNPNPNAPQNQEPDVVTALTEQIRQVLKLLPTDTVIGLLTETLSSRCGPSNSPPDLLEPDPRASPCPNLNQENSGSVGNGSPDTMTEMKEHITQRTAIH